MSLTLTAFRSAFSTRLIHSVSSVSSALSGLKQIPKIRTVHGTRARGYHGIAVPPANEVRRNIREHYASLAREQQVTRDNAINAARTLGYASMKAAIVAKLKNPSEWDNGPVRLLLHRRMPFGLFSVYNPYGDVYEGGKFIASDMLKRELEQLGYQVKLDERAVSDDHHELHLVVDIPSLPCTHPE